MSSEQKRRFAILRFACYLSAAAITCVVWITPGVRGNPWASVVWFALFASIAESLSVSMDEADSCRHQGNTITPTAPILWAACCVLGPYAAILVGVICGVLGDLIYCVSFHAANALRSRLGGAEGGRIRKGLIARLQFLGKPWEHKTGYPFLYVVQMSAQYVASLVLSVGLSGLAYHGLGGHFLIDSAPGLFAARHFVLPFLGIVAVSVAVEHSLHLVMMATIDPVPGARGFSGVLLRMKLALVDNALPIVRAELPMAVVALMLAYLYAHLGITGFVLAAMPVVALRDLLGNWLGQKAAYTNTITTLATYMQQYHPYTRGHLKRVADLSERLARELRLSVDSIRYIGTAGFLHDIGKIGVSEQILDKPGRPSDEEWEMIKAHPVKGADIVTHIEYFEGIVNWIKYHHKWYDGGGYPDVNGDGQVPIEAAIIGVADAFDAMTDDRELTLNWKCDVCGYKPDDGSKPEVCPNCNASKNRTYREPKSLDEAIDELRRGAGTQFHPKVIKAFMTMIERDGLHVDAE